MRKPESSVPNQVGTLGIFTQAVNALIYVFIPYSP